MWDPDDPDARWANLIGDIYDAALTPEYGPEISRLLADVGGGNTGAICLFGTSSMEALLYNVSAQALALYDQHFSAVDPWTSHAMTHGRNGYLPAVIGRRIVPEDELIKTEFFHDFARRFDMAEVIGGSVPIGCGKVAVFSTHRTWNGRRFEAEDERRIRRLAPHLQRALQLRERLGVNKSSVGFAALDRLAFGTIVCDAAGHVIFANTAAEEAMRAGDGIVLGSATTPIGALRPAEGKRLLALVRDVCQGKAGGTIGLSGRTDTILMTLVAPLPRRLGRGPPMALLALRSVTSRATVDTEALSTIFGLTPAEAALAASIGGGHSLAEIGVARGTTENTLRTQLAHVFRKTGTRNQADLVRLIGMIPPLL